jgi:RNA polymerase sigma-70 factor (ECF subfamily)
MMTLVSEISMVTVHPTDGVLVGQVLAGQKSAFDELVSRYQRRATAVAYRLLGNLQDALEVAQEAFLKAFTNLTTLQKAEAFGPWLLRIVSNLSLNLRRSRRSLAVLPLDDLLPSAGTMGADHFLTAATHNAEPCCRMQRAEVRSRIEQALGQLSRRQREAISLFTLEEIPQKQVAQTLGCSVEAVKWHVFEGRRKLKEILKDCL